MSSLLFHLYILLAILVLYNLYTHIAIFHLPVSSVFPTQTSGATPYEFLMFTQQWPKAVNESSPLAQFTIHGLWPSKYKSGPVLRCNGTDFDENKMTPDLEKKLNISWPDVEKGNNMGFWEYEYNKHGRCSEETFSQTEYFELANKMWGKLDIAQMLANRSIVPGKNYTTSEVVAAIKKATQHNITIRCKGQILHEVIVCYDHDGKQVIDCDRDKSNCGQSISYVK
ncbi:ribonuclease MC-like [Pyrus x bretschneideri]|uniref:ribonuclease MC-like n=1 Tax=Pyrus x bretschneideri TaxID=225117 RepID=UPI002030F85D|nr:ribonuclease MC-like [Pyrus x bretschneideri]